MKLKIYKMFFKILVIISAILFALVIFKYVGRYKTEIENQKLIVELSSLPPTHDENFEINGYKIVGKIEIPKIKIEYPIIDVGIYNPDTIKEPMKTSIVKYWGNDVNDYGNLTIAGHNNRDGTMFGKLKKLQVGDIVEVENLEKTKIEYRVYSIFITNPNDVEVLKGDTDFREITMITCTNGNKNRLIVKAREV